MIKFTMHRSLEASAVLRVHWETQTHEDDADATPADVIAAIEADEGLRQDVIHHYGSGIRKELHAKVLDDLAAARVDQRCAESRVDRAESDRDAWKARAEKAEKERDEARSLERDAARRIAHLEKELAIAHDTDGQPWNMTADDAEELRARRALDGWMLCAQFRTLSVRRVCAGVSELVATDNTIAHSAQTYVSLARKLGLL